MLDGTRKSYIRLHRKLLDHSLFKDKPVAWLKIWIYILLRANWRESTPLVVSQCDLIGRSQSSQISAFPRLLGYTDLHEKRFKPRIRAQRIKDRVTAPGPNVVPIVDKALFQPFKRLVLLTEDAEGRRDRGGIGRLRGRCLLQIFPGPRLVARQCVSPGEGGEIVRGRERARKALANL
jgi:hypothetical protein